jgi:signal transduction histidine kinase
MTDVDHIEEYEGSAPATSAGSVGLTPVIGLRQPTPRRVATIEAEVGNYRRETGAPREVAVQTPPIELFRWASLAVGAILAAGDLHLAVYVAGLLLLLYAGFRTLKPITLTGSSRAATEIGLELVFHVVIIAKTGSWSSPFVIVLLPTVVAAGFARGYAFALELSTVTSVVLGVWFDKKFNTHPQPSYAVTLSAAWLALFLLVSLVSSYSRHVLEENARQQTLTLDRLGRLAEANKLLFQLNTIAQTLPSSLDMGEVLDSTIAQLRDLIDFDAITILLLEDSDRTWVPVREVGNPDQTSLTTSQLPPVLIRALGQQGALTEGSLNAEQGGLWPEARSGIYASLSARGSQIGLMALESSESGQFQQTDVEVLDGITDSFSYAVSNARMFSRLRTIGAEEERTRIARDLHDQIGQALAHLGFEIDRAKRASDRGEDMSPRLVELRGEVGGVTRMVRDTLYDLRTDVTESQDMLATMELFLSRVKERAGLEVSIAHEASGRLPLIQEREMWRIAKEAVINVERHAHAKSLTLTWRSDGRSAELVVSDDGVGLDPEKGRFDSYGMMGMRERAATISARLEIDSEPGQGTNIRVSLANP